MPEFHHKLWAAFQGDRKGRPYYTTAALPQHLRVSGRFRPPFSLFPSQAGLLGAVAPDQGLGCPQLPFFFCKAGLLGAVAPDRGLGCPQLPLWGGEDLKKCYP